ncbi:MAG: DMT family transporter [Hyphomicrobiales bacterium]|nr:DMT family transporter [Hyphomicrobiales bacterium]
MDIATSPPVQARQRVVGYALLLFMGLIWGLAVSMSKLAGLNGGHPIGLALWQVSVAGTMLFLASLASGRPPPLRPRVLGFNLICGLTGVAFPAIALFWSALMLPAGIVAISFASMPLFTYLLSVIFGIEAGTVRRLAGVFLGLAAMALLVVPDGALPAPDLAPWVLLAIAASVSMSVENFTAGGYRPDNVTSLQLSCGRQYGAAIFLAPLALISGTTIALTGEWGVVHWAATATGVISGVAYTCLLHVIRTSGPVFASQTAYIITLAGVGWGMVIFGERHSIYIWLALALTLVAIALVTPRAPRATGFVGHARVLSQHPGSDDPS